MFVPLALCPPKRDNNNMNEVRLYAMLTEFKSADVRSGIFRGFYSANLTSEWPLGSHHTAHNLPSGHSTAQRLRLPIL